MPGMVNTQRRSAFAVAGFVVIGSVLAASASGQSVLMASPEVAPLARAYGAGVHAYFAGDHQRSYDDLTQAIEAGSEDPRAWYFRGLAALKLGRLDEAEADFASAAERESENVADWNVSRALERVQGHDRLALERHRIRARVAALQRRTEAARNRYLGTDARQPDVLRRIRPVGPGSDPLGLFTDEAAAPPVERVPPPEEPADDADAEPAADDMEVPAADGEMPAEEVERVEPLPAEATGDEVFGDEQ